MIGSVLEPTTGFLLVRVAQAIDRRFSARLEPLRLKPRQLHVLRHLDASGPVSQTELAQAIEVDAANLIETLDGLQADGLISREVDAGDRRRRRLRMTPAGRRKLRAGLRAADQADDDILGALEPEQLAALRDAVRRVYDTRV